jgi:hypothetical protein
VGIDEHGITNAYSMTFFDKLNEKFNLKIDNFFFQFLKKKRLKKLYLVEQYTTPFTPIKWLDGTLNGDQPTTWYYNNGVITNNRDNRNFMYIHFMNFKSSQWRHDGTKDTWEGIKTLYHVNKEDFNNRIRINSNGINLSE